MAEHERPAADRLEDRPELHALISDLSPGLVDLLPVQVVDESGRAPRGGCEPLGVALSLSWAVPSDSAPPPRVHPRRQCTTGRGSAGRRFGRRDVLPIAAGVRARRRPLVSESLDELPEVAVAGGENLRRFGVRSNLTIRPAVDGAPPIGALGLESTQTEASRGEP